MSGNVLEWVNTIFDTEQNIKHDSWDWGSRSFYPYPYATDDGREANSNNLSDFRTVRGGWWGPSHTAFIQDVQTTSRFGYNPSFSSTRIGFRCAKF
jgi:formylglycine-generating enzyme required for sulfatase activity